MFKKKTIKKPPVAIPDLKARGNGSATLSSGGEAGAHPKTVSHQGKEMKVNGYNCNLVKPHPKQMRIYCMLCRAILCDPCLTTCCGENFCQGCLEQLIEANSTCPGCWAVGYDGFNNEALQKELKKIEVYCEHQDEGCQWIGTLKKLKTHLNPYNIDDSKSCGWIQVQCHLCSKHVPRNILQRHLAESCMQRRYQCQYCGEFKSTFEDVMNNHKPVCKFSPVVCPNNCGEAVMQLDMESHVNNDCLRTVVNCEFRIFGCTTKPYRQNMPQHMNDRSTIHQTMLARGLKDMMRDTRKFRAETKAELTRLREDNRQLRQTIEELDSATLNGKTPIVILNRDSKDSAVAASDASKIDLVTAAEFTMTGFCKYKRENAAWRSPAFYTKQRGRRMCLEVLANGNKEVKGQYMSISIHFMHGEFDKEVSWPFRGDLVVELVSQSKGGAPISQTLRYTENTPRELSNLVTEGDVAVKGKMMAKFVHLSQLPPNYLKNDSLQFKILRYKLIGKASL